MSTSPTAAQFNHRHSAASLQDTGRDSFYSAYYEAHAPNVQPQISYSHCSQYSECEILRLLQPAQSLLHYSYVADDNRTRSSSGPNTGTQRMAQRISPLRDRPKPMILAHRGASDHAPENSLAAFRLAIEAGADMIETDLWFTRDGVIVCHHDATIQRMTGDRRRIVDLTLAELQSIRMRSRFDDRYPDERIPTLAELLELAPSSVGLLVELKDPRFAEPAWAGKLATQTAARVASEMIVAVSFHSRLIRGLRQADPTFPIGHIPVTAPFPLQRVDVFGPIWPLLLLNPGYVAWVHRRGKWICPLDEHPHKRLRWYLRMGVDAILTNDPAATRALIAQLRGLERV